jgi:NADPH:quinone reductase-like Zn-dependent oxidoreductase
VIVSGATGGVGALAVQLTAARGAYVLGTARPGEDEAYLRDLGTSDTVDFTGDVPAAVAALRPNGIHAAIHLAGDGLELADLLAPGGRIPSTLGWPRDQLDRLSVQAMPVTAMPVTAVLVTAVTDSPTLERLAADVVNGQLTVPVQRTYPLADVPRVLADFTAGTRKAGHRRGMTVAALAAVISRRRMANCSPQDPGPRRLATARTRSALSLRERDASAQSPAGSPAAPRSGHRNRR